MGSQYTLLEYHEAGRWVPYFTSDRLWECQYQASRLAMPWRIVCDGKLIQRGDGQAIVLT